jgi:tripartite-type tricarboxylate transporter receptor subunit TctC
MPPTRLRNGACWWTIRRGFTVSTEKQKRMEETPLQEVKAAFAKVGVMAQPSTPDQLMARLKADIVKWNEVIDKAKIPRK